jgi:hypothetical protein
VYELASIFSLGSGGAARATTVALALMGGAVGAFAGPSFVGQRVASQPPVAADGCDDAALGVDAEPWERSELFFGTAKPDGSEVTEAEWTAFLAAEVTPRFPDGLTVLEAAGQWQGEDGEVVRERSKQLILLYPSEATVEAGEKIEAIRAAYETAFAQESVLRADDGEPAPVCVSF